MLASAPITTIAIVGAGFSGCLVVVHLLKTANRPLPIEPIDRSHEIGPGVAYSTDATSHLLMLSQNCASRHWRWLRR
ncbi:FAD/NAD(P)-binding protein [Microcoleus sp. herbarium2]|uniref:FAD/NAD(P)-binding protein n=1 Tax=Microcoleus sp. herbarium2 TaxID=3055433 RepID=UPI002FD12103